MLRRLRNRLRRIDYYSASRRRTIWTRAGDIAFVASLALAVPLAFLCDRVIIRSTEAISLPGQFFREPDASISAILLNSVNRIGPSEAATPYGSFVLSVEDRLHGWPLTTSMSRQPARVDIDLPAERRRVPNAQLADTDPLRVAILDILRREGHRETLAALTDSAPVVRRQWIAWPIAAGVWWIVLAFASSSAIGLLHLVSHIVHRNRAIRRAHLNAENKCAGCGYDLTGLEFNERCPECGSLVY